MSVGPSSLKSIQQIPSVATTPTNTVSSDKYLELMFNLYDYTFDNLDIYTNEKSQKVLLIKALKQCETPLPQPINNGGENFKSQSDLTINSNIKTYIRKYILPDWVSNKNINVFQETKDINNVIKNTLVVQLPIIA